jgi:hypothetical protein
LGSKRTQVAIKAEEFFKLRLLIAESIKWFYTQRVKLHLNKTKENEIDVEKGCKNLEKF